MSDAAATLADMLRSPSTSTPPHTVILETPETLAILLTAYLGRDRHADAHALIDGIDDAANVAVAALPHPWHLAQLDRHMTPEHDPGLPSPHVHIVLGDVESSAAVRQWAVTAHETFQKALSQHVLQAGVGITRNAPTPAGWEVTGLIARLGAIGRPRCLPPSAHVVYPADGTASTAPPMTA